MAEDCSYLRSAERGADLARLRDVALHLCDQLLGRGEAPLAPQPPDEGNPQLAAVEVLVAIDQVGLDQEPPPCLEGRANADVDRRRMSVGESGEDAVAGRDQLVVGDDVGGRKAQLAPA